MARRKMSDTGRGVEGALVTGLYGAMVGATMRGEELGNIDDDGVGGKVSRSTRQRTRGGE